MFASGRIATGSLIAMLLGAPEADAADAAAKCQAAKLKIAAKYTLCNLNAQAKSVKAPAVGQLSEDLAKCTASFDTKWAKAEEKGGADCPTSGDAGKFSTAVNRVSGDLVLATSPTRYVDNGDGTITDPREGLMWEKKDGGNDGGTPNFLNVHDVDNTYQWSKTGITPDGGVFTEFLAALNNCSTSDVTGFVGGGFAGHCDWRLPTGRELYALHIPDPFDCPGFPCIDAAFLPTGYSPEVFTGERYWTFLTGDASTTAGLIGFDYTSAFYQKTTHNYVRAVRTIGGPLSSQ